MGLLQTYYCGIISTTLIIVYELSADCVVQQLLLCNLCKVRHIKFKIINPGGPGFGRTYLHPNIYLPCERVLSLHTNEIVRASEVPTSKEEEKVNTVLTANLFQFWYTFHIIFIIRIIIILWNVCHKKFQILQCRDMLYHQFNVLRVDFHSLCLYHIFPL